MRTSYGLQADTAAWIVTAYALPYLILMPVYGKLGDKLGKRCTLMAGVSFFLLGTGLNLLSDGLPWLLLGRAIQGVGASGVVPLAIASVSEAFPLHEQGRALGRWNSVGPVTGSLAYFSVGIIIDTLGWRQIFIPPLIVGAVALFLVWKLAPVSSRRGRSDPMRGFDWTGAALLGLGLSALVLYLSSETITNVRPLRDWRLLSITLVVFSGFVLWEKRQVYPFVDLRMFSRRTLVQASICAALRTVALSGIAFLMPLYLVDVRGFSATLAGLTLVPLSICLFPTMRLGGRWVDRWGRRWPLIVGVTLQVGTMAYLALLRSTAHAALVIVGLAIHGLSAGMAQAALHRTAMADVPDGQTGAAAGVYSLIRYCGQLIGPVGVGAVLQQGLNRGLGTEAFQRGFWFLVSLGLIGVVTAFTVGNGSSASSIRCDQQTEAVR
jgi:MFS family permease